MKQTTYEDVLSKGELC